MFRNVHLVLEAYKCRTYASELNVLKLTQTAEPIGAASEDKKMTKIRLRILVGACAGFLLSAPVRADIMGSIWENQAAASANATPANVPGTAPDVTFDVPGTSINFQSQTSINGYTIGGYLSSGGATITSGASHAADNLNNTIFNITGTVTVTNGETFTAGHDDGLTLIIGGTTVISVPGPTSFATTTETYTGPSGNFPFQLVYGECCGAPADLEISGLALVSSVPEPSSVVLMSSVLLVVGFVLRKRFAKAV